MSTDYKLYTIEKDGRTVKLKSSQLTTQVLSKLFGLFPDSILLLSEDGYVETADPDGRFDDVDDLPVWSVGGESMKPVVAGPGPGPSTSVAPYLYQPSVSKRGKGKGKWTPGGMRKPPGVRAEELERQDQTATVPHSKQPAEWRKSIEVCKWSDDGWRKMLNLPIVMTEESASVPSVTQMVANDAFNGEETVLLDIDYLKIPNTSATRGECTLVCVAIDKRALLSMV